LKGFGRPTACDVFSPESLDCDSPPIQTRRPASTVPVTRKYEKIGIRIWISQPEIQRERARDVPRFGQIHLIRYDDTAFERCTIVKIDHVLIDKSDAAFGKAPSRGRIGTMNTIVLVEVENASTE
jgi:hypothetical protein